jgi:hypothetical protein
MTNLHWQVCDLVLATWSWQFSGGLDNGALWQSGFGQHKNLTRKIIN